MLFLMIKNQETIGKMLSDCWAGALVVVKVSKISGGRRVPSERPS